MNSQSDYLLLIRGTDWGQGYSPQEMEEVLGEFTGWLEGLQREGKVKAANPLANEGKVVSGANGRVVHDGPFAESKEAIGGYFLLSVAGMDEAVSIAQACPALAHGARMEVRPIVAECALMIAVRERAAELAHV